MTQDNDSKHYNDITRALLAEYDIKLMSSLRKKADGSHPDRVPGRGGHMVDYADSYFPCYSPDFNGPIEKCWRECQKRVLARAKEILSRDDMMRIVKEEWHGLEFEKTERWCGINHLVEKVPHALKEAIDNGGWDTSHMKN